MGVDMALNIRLLGMTIGGTQRVTTITITAS